MNLIEELLHLVDAFDAARVDYAVCGGISLAIHGLPRFTEDIDILIQTSDLERALAAARPCGFSLEGGLMTFGAGTSVERTVFRVSKAAGPDLISLDLLQVVPAYEDVWRDRVTHAWLGRQIRVVSAEGLRKMKRLAGRTQDVADLERLDELGRKSGGNV